MLKRLDIAAIGMTLALTSALAEDWPQWRGPQRDGVWRESGVVGRFEQPQLPIKWRVPIAGGYCGPTVANGRVYVMDRVIEPTQRERVHCFDEATGAVVWSHQYDCAYRDVSYDAGPRASVHIDGSRAYSFGTMGDLFCFKAADGTVIWHHDLDAEYDVAMPIWGLASAPLVFEDLLIVQVGGQNGDCVVAFDKHSGKERWKALPDPAGYAAPILIQQAGRPVVVMWTGDHVNGLAPKTGEVLWRHEWKPKRMVIGVSTPVLSGNKLFLTSFFDGSLVLELDDKTTTVREVWRRAGESEKNTDALHSIIATPIVREGHVYGVDSYGELRCLDLATGDRIWESLEAVPKARWSTAHLIEHPGSERTWLFNERGDLIIARLTTAGYDEISRTHLIDPTTDQLGQRGGVCWSHPAFANRHVFARNDRELVCASVAATGSQQPTTTPTAKKVDPQRRAELEAWLTETLTEAQLAGTWQMTTWEGDGPKSDLGAAMADVYTISKVTKMAGDRWIVQARIQYADKDVELPVPVEVHWAGDTPVITLDNIMLPFLGKYSARVLFHGEFYSGVWLGSNYGGVMSGQIKR